MRTQKRVPGRHKPSALPSSPDEAPEVLQALAKAEENAVRAHSAKTAQDREYYERMAFPPLGGPGFALAGVLGSHPSGYPAGLKFAL